MTIVWQCDGEVPSRDSAIPGRCDGTMACQTKRDNSVHMTRVDPHYNYNHCKECCSVDLCNNEGCNEPGYPVQRGPVCFNCDQVYHPTLCDKIKVCASNQECYLQRELEFGDVYYSSRCINKQACTSSLQIFGKRESEHCSHCCQTDLCNNNCGGLFSSSPITATAPLQKGIQGEEFLILFMKNYHKATGSENAYILTNTEYVSSVNITSSPHLDNAIKSNVDSFVNFTSFVNISFPYNLTCQYLMKESKAVLLKISEISTVIIFDSYYKYTNDGTSIIPTRKLSTEYLITTVLPGEDSGNQIAVGSFHSETHLKIKLEMRGNGTLTVYGVQYSTGDTLSISLEKFETFQINYHGDLSGTFISANKPCAVFSGNRCKTFPGTTCSHMVSQLPPIREYDNEYIIPFFYENKKTLCQVISPVLNIVNITIGTKTTTLVLQAHEYHNFEIDQNLTSIVKADHPVQVSGFAMGSENDPYMTVIPGIRHYLDYYKIIVPDNYTDSYLCVIIPRQSLGNLKINNLSVNDFTTVFQSDERSSGKTYIICMLSVSHGVYVLKTTDRVGFGLIVYGHRPDDGYGYAGNFLLP